MIVNTVIDSLSFFESNPETLESILKEYLPLILSGIPLGAVLNNQIVNYKNRTTNISKYIAHDFRFISGQDRISYNEDFINAIEDKCCLFQPSHIATLEDIEELLYYSNLLSTYLEGLKSSINSLVSSTNEEQAFEALIGVIGNELFQKKFLAFLIEDKEMPGYIISEEEVKSYGLKPNNRIILTTYKDSYSINFLNIRNMIWEVQDRNEGAIMQYTQILLSNLHFFHLENLKIIFQKFLNCLECDSKTLFPHYDYYDNILKQHSSLFFYIVISNFTKNSIVFDTSPSLEVSSPKSTKPIKLKAALIDENNDPVDMHYPILIKPNNSVRIVVLTDKQKDLPQTMRAILFDRSKKAKVRIRWKTTKPGFNQVKDHFTRISL